MVHARAVTVHDLLSTSSTSTLGRDLAAGALAGQIAGLIMAVVMMTVFTFVLGKGPLFPVQVIGSIAFGDAAVQGLHLPALIVGLLLHQAGPSLAWGLALGAVLHLLDQRSVRAVAVVGAGLGLASQIVDVNLVLPIAMRALHGHDLWAENVPAGWSWAAHLVFGLSLASFPAVLQRLASRPAPAPGAGPA